MVVVEVLFWLALSGMLLAYLLYPLVMMVLRRMARPSTPPAPKNWPAVEILFAAHNEEAVLEAKLESVLQSEYPPEKITIRVGSDCSTDATNAILQKWQQKHPQVVPYFFEERQGKSAIINYLAQRSQAPYLLLTDANIIFEPCTLAELVKVLAADPRSAAVGGAIHYTAAPAAAGISRQESTYLSWENRIKEAESQYLKLCMGLEGGCYLIRRPLFPEIPALFFMEDFFVTLTLLQQGQRVRFCRKAKVHEDVSTQAQEEYKRKFRISIGNFQNLGRFYPLLWRKFWPVGLAFLLHKVLRWFTPFFLLLLLLSGMALFFQHPGYALFSGAYAMFLALGIFGILFSQKKGWTLLKYPGHFFYMNIALLDGFITYLKGVQSNAWQPTKRNQT